MRTIKFNKKWKRIGSGSFAHYYKISKNRGIKILHSDNLRETIDDAKLELKLLQRASITGCAPKGYEVVKVLTDERYYEEDIVYIGIIMEHLDAKRLSVIGAKSRRLFEEQLGEQLTVEEIMSHTLAQVGILHDDLHTANILAKMKNGKITKVYAVDFSPECTFFIKRQKVVFK